MRPTTHATQFLILAAALLAAAPAQAQKVWFSPNGGTSAAIVADIDKAARSIDVAAFSITDTPILRALARAAARGVPVRVVLDRRQASLPNSAAANLPRLGLNSRFDPNHITMHAKSIQIDRVVTWAGSYNWSDNAETRNVEITFRVLDPDTNAALAVWFERLYTLCKPYARNAAAGTKTPSPLFWSTGYAKSDWPLHVAGRDRHVGRHVDRDPLERTQCHPTACHPHQPQERQADRRPRDAQVLGCPLGRNGRWREGRLRRGRLRPRHFGLQSVLQ